VTDWVADLQAASAAAPPLGGGIDWAAELSRPAPHPGPGVNTTIRRGSYPENIMRQATQGATFGFADEVGSALGALRAYFTDDEYGQLYDRILEQNREQDKAFQAENPVAATAAQIGGAVATAPFTPALQAARGAGLGARAGAGLVTGAATGAAYGAGTGEGMAGRAEGAVTGGLLGAGAGAALPVVGAGLRAAGGAIAAPFRGVAGADREAARRVGQAFTNDAADIPSAQRAMQMGQAEGVPLVAGDAGGETVRALARSAANTSQPARERLQQVTNDRFEHQGGRIARLTQAITGARKDTAGIDEALQEAARRANRPAYVKAYRDGAGGLWDTELQQLATAPDVQEAMKAAVRTGMNRSAAEGYAPIKQPFDFLPDGTVQLKPGAVPNLQFWDHVQRNLADTITTAQRSGANSAGRDATMLHRQLIDHLDAAVPSFGQARAGAAAFFGARDALEVGRDLVSSRMETASIRRGLAKMNDVERRMVREAFSNEILRQIEATSDRVNVANKIFASPQARERIDMVLGDEAGRRLEAMVRVENIMNSLRAAVSGNSTTVRQLVEAGLAGGATGAWYGSMDPSSIGYGMLIGSALRFGHQRIDTRVARRVGEMLASDDPQVLEQAARMVARNARLMEAVRAAEAWLARSLAPAQPEVSLRSVIGGATDERDQPSDNLGR
jgi:hypothetical protein